jgi:glucose-6-phosphate dehydrogenase assembly protein OpcA
MEPGRAEQALAELWRQASGAEHPVVRACGLNLVIACADGEAELHEAGRLVAAISEAVPARALVVTPGHGRATREAAALDLSVAVHSHSTADGVVVCSEQVTIEVAPSDYGLVPATVRQLVVEELPVHVWWRRPDLLRDPLLGILAQVAERLIVDSASPKPKGAELAEIEAASSGGAFENRVADIHWTRLEPWREALASFFDDPGQRRALGTVHELAVTTGGTRARSTGALYLAGWLTSRLGWRPGASPDEWLRPDGGAARLHFEDDSSFPEGEIGSARLVLGGSGGTQRACVAQRSSDRPELVVLSVETGGTCPPRRRIRFAPADTAALAIRVLQRPASDPVFDAALAAAARIA